MDTPIWRTRSRRRTRETPAASYRVFDMSVAGFTGALAKRRSRAGLGLAPGSSPRKNGPSGDGADDNAVALILRTTAQNRVGNQVCGASRRITAAADRTAPSRFTRCRVSRRDQSLRPATPSFQASGRLTGRACGRRPVHGVRSEDGKSGLEARRSAVAGDATAYGQAR